MFSKKNILIGLLLALLITLIVLFSQEKTDIFIYSNF